MNSADFTTVLRAVVVEEPPIQRMGVERKGERACRIDVLVLEPLSSSLSGKLRSQWQGIRGTDTRRALRARIRGSRNSFYVEKRPLRVTRATFYVEKRPFSST